MYTTTQPQLLTQHCCESRHWAKVDASNRDWLSHREGRDAKPPLEYPHRSSIYASTSRPRHRHPLPRPPPRERHVRSRAATCRYAGNTAGAVIRSRPLTCRLRSRTKLGSPMGLMNQPLCGHRFGLLVWPIQVYANPAWPNYWPATTALRHLAAPRHFELEQLTWL